LRLGKRQLLIHGTAARTVDMSSTSVDKFAWQCQPAAATLVESLVDDFCRQSDAARRLGQRMLRETGTRLFDWVDYVGLGEDQVDGAALAEAGFTLRRENGATVAEHAGGIFPTLWLDCPAHRLGIKVESVADFLHVHGLADLAVHGAPWARLRTALIAREADAELWIVERHGYLGFETYDPSVDEVESVLRHEEAFRCRRRQFEWDDEGFDLATELAAAAVVDLGVDRACDLFFKAERDYWMSRNRAGRLQKARQDAMGLGWGNHDHHTYRSSRQHFARLIELLEALGLTCRERFYAGVEAGWGAQVLEQPACRLMVFADVDLSPDEVAGDFAQERLAPRNTLGTVGLWCALHGEAVLQAGMHHLEAQFDFRAAREQLDRDGVRNMAPFTDFSFLKQAFTQGEMWPVDPRRLAAARAAGYITAEQADQFARRGALGSHLEILERNEGYKGFNQTGISHIIRRTDPRGETVGA
jgi:hypothetical protein